MNLLDDWKLNLSQLEKLIKDVKLLKKQYLELLDENRYLKLELEEKNQQIESQKICIKNLENQLKVRNLINRIDTSENQQQYIIELLKEIDACLSLLEK